MYHHQPIYTQETACQDCYRCLRECPVKAIVVRDGMAAIDAVRCIYCGTCIGVCPVEAKKVRNDIPAVQILLAQEKRVIVSIAPSFIASFPQGLPTLSAGLAMLGFAGVSETALGAHLISKDIAEWMRQSYAEGRLPPLTISTACPTIVSLIRKHHPRLVALLSPFCSPLIAHCRYLKQQAPVDTNVVFIGPCPAKKTEVSDSAGMVDAVLSFVDLTHWFEQQGIDLDTIEPLGKEFIITASSTHGCLYPIEGGMIESIKAFAPLPPLEMQTISGLEAVNEILHDIAPEKLRQPVFLELLACKGGCINGACMPRSGELLLKREEVRTYAMIQKTHDLGSQPLNLHSCFASENMPTSTFSTEQIRLGLERIGKLSHEDELNCSGCGYPSCRDFVRALLENRAEPAMCVSYMRSLAMKKANALMLKMPAGAVIANSDLTIIECNLRFVQIAVPELVDHFVSTQSLNTASLNKMVPLAKYFKAVLNTSIPITDKQIHLSGRIVSMSVFPIEAGQIIGGIIQDITQPAVRKEQIISKAREVSRRQLIMVQQIASLLGENAAESETLLGEIMRSFAPADDDSSPTS